MTLLFYYFLLFNGIAFVLTAYDKYLAKAHKNRISEKTLLIFVLVGGSIGSGFAMLVFKHKTSKESYLLKFWLIILAQIFIFLLLLYFGIIQY